VSDLWDLLDAESDGGLTNSAQMGWMLVESEYKSEGNLSEVQGWGVRLTGPWLQLVRCAILRVTRSQFTEGQDKGQGERSRDERAKGPEVQGENQ
jgi:hypothetical protein